MNAALQSWCNEIKGRGELRGGETPKRERRRKERKSCVTNADSAHIVQKHTGDCAHHVHRSRIQRWLAIKLLLIGRRGCLHAAQNHGGFLHVKAQPETFKDSGAECNHQVPLMRTQGGFSREGKVFFYFYAQILLMGHIWAETSIGGIHSKWSKLPIHAVIKSGAEAECQ